MLEIRSHSEAQGRKHTVSGHSSVSTLRTLCVGGGVVAVMNSGMTPMNPGMTPMDPPPIVVHIDQNLLKELTKRFPEIPQHVVISLIQENGNDRELCMMALVRKSENYSVVTTSSEVVIPINESNGFRQRSDSAGSNLHNTSHEDYSQIVHSASNPVMHPGNTMYSEHGRNTAFHRKSIDDTPTPFGGYFQGNHYVPHWRPIAQAAHGDTVARPGQFDEQFPPVHYHNRDSSLSSSSPQTPTRVPNCKSPATTPTRSIPRFDNYSAVTPPSSSGYMFQTHSPPQLHFNQRDAQSSSITFVSQVEKYIGPHGNENNVIRYQSPPSISIQVGPRQTIPIYTRPSHTPVDFSLAHALSGGVSLNVRQTPPTRSISATWTKPGHNPGIVYRPPGLVTMLSSGSSPGGTVDYPEPGRQSRSDSIASVEDSAYMQSLLQHQKSRLDKLRQDLIAAFEICDREREKVAANERELIERRKSRCGLRPSISITDLQKVREENRALQVDSHLLTLEFDRITKGEPIIGQDPNEDFYAKNFPGGQKSIVLMPVSSSTETTHSTTAAPNDVNHPPAPPTASTHDRELQHVREVEEDNWNCSACTFANHPELSSCEICNMPRLGRR